MMFIIFNKRADLTWWIGNDIELSPAEVNDVYMVQADGHELKYIERIYTNIPMRNAMVVRWFGDDAKFIAGNL